MSKPELELLKRVDVHEAWPHESSDFTPWLARSENIALLGETIGLDLEIEGEEVAVGPFSADILCKDTTTGHYVVVENQLWQTDHKHLD